MEIAYYEESRTYGVSLKLFTDDLEKGVERQTGEELRLATEAEHEDADSLIARYIRPRISIGGKTPVKWTFLGKECEYDVTWIYLESVPVEPVDDLRVENTILMEVYDDQTHVVQYTEANETQSSLLHRNKRSVRF
jgi:hypothetical protein